MSSHPLQPPLMDDWRRSSPIAGGNAEYVEALYETYPADANAVSPQWRD